MNTERDYLNIANQQTEQEILDKHWETVKRMKIWVSSSGERTHFKDIENTHLITIIKMLVRFHGERPSQPLQELINELLEETKIRLKIKNSKEMPQSLRTTVVDETQPTDTFKRMRVIKVCSNCSEEINNPLNYCPHCGQKLGKE